MFVQKIHMEDNGVVVGRETENLGGGAVCLVGLLAPMHTLNSPSRGCLPPSSKHIPTGMWLVLLPFSPFLIFFFLLPSFSFVFHFSATYATPARTPTQAPRADMDATGIGIDLLSQTPNGRQVIIFCISVFP